MSSNLGLVFKFWYNNLVHKNLGDPPLDCICIYILLHNVNIVMLLDANSIDTKNLKGVDSVGFPDSAGCHTHCTTSLL